MSVESTRTFQTIQKMSREELELALFYAVAAMRGQAKGEIPPPPAHVDRFAFLQLFANTAKLHLKKKAGSIYAASATADKPVEDLSLAAAILSKIGKL